MFDSRYLTSVFLASVCVAIAVGYGANYTVEDIINSRCSPGQECYPTTAQIDELENSMTGSIVRKTDSTYQADNLMYNTNQQTTPHLIAMVKSKEDIQKVVLFARQYNLHLTIKSTGHDYCGRSTWVNSTTIHLGNMKTIDVNSSKTARSEYGELKTETGTNWATIYQLVVLADGSIATCTESETVIVHPNGTSETRADGDLLWALRGGGGGTFGVTVYIIYKLHPEPSQMVQFSGTFPLNFESGVPWVNDDVHGAVMTALKNFILNSPPHWGGYWILQNQPFKYSTVNMRGSLFLFLNKLAPWDNNERNELAGFLALKEKYQLGDVVLTNKSSFWEYEKNANDPPTANVYLVASLLGRAQAQSSLVDFTKKEFFDTFRNIYLGCTGILVGGKTTEQSATYVPLNPGYRSAVSIMSCGVPYTKENVEEAKKLAYRLRLMGEGMYFNEPSIDSRYWREDYWGNTNYERLLTTKQRYDPENLFTCYHCVNSEQTSYSTDQSVSYSTTISYSANQTETSGSAQTHAQWFWPTVAILYTYVM